MAKIDAVIDTNDDIKYLTRAFELAQKGYGCVSPNPYVGAVLVKDGLILGEGYHEKSGFAHAEVNAVKDATERGNNIVGATLYVTLEPCCFSGKTPACTDLILHSGIDRVVTAMEDPNPKVAGKGHEILRNKDIDVTTNLMVNEGHELLRIFMVNQLLKRPFVTLKAAMSLDGKLATQSRDSQWITGEEARKKAHYYRGMHDAILVGKGTLLADNPSLTVRYGFQTKAPSRVLLLNNFEDVTPAVVDRYHFFNTDLAPSLVLYNQANQPNESLKDLLRQKGVELIPLPNTQPASVISTLYSKGFMSIFIEGGAGIYDAFLTADCVDEFLLFYGPKLIGNTNALELWRNSPITKLSEAPEVTIKEIQLCGKSIYLRAQRER